MEGRRGGTGAPKLTDPSSAESEVSMADFMVKEFSEMGAVIAGSASCRMNPSATSPVSCSAFGP